VQLEPGLGILPRHESPIEERTRLRIDHHYLEPPFRLDAQRRCGADAVGDFGSAAPLYRGNPHVHGVEAGCDQLGVQPAGRFVLLPDVNDGHSH
jgi:hypothetical protein